MLQVQLSVQSNKTDSPYAYSIFREAAVSLCVKDVLYTLVSNRAPLAYKSALPSEYTVLAFLAYCIRIKESRDVFQSFPKWLLLGKEKQSLFFMTGRIKSS